jgi:hypothetical protein
MNRVIRTRITKALFLILLVFALGTTGFYVLLDGLTLIDSLYLTIVTLATVGYGDFSPHMNMPPGGNPYLIKFFAIFIILFGMSALLYGIGVMTEYIVSGELLGERRRKRMQKLIASLNSHYIICGAGETSVYMMQGLEKTQRPFVVIEKSEERIQQILNQFDEMLLDRATRLKIAEVAVDRKSICSSGADPGEGERERFEKLCSVIIICYARYTELSGLYTDDPCRLLENRRQRVIYKV